MAIHVVVFPFPAQGHITPMLRLAELLSVAGLHVTFLNTDYSHRRLLSFSAAYARLARRPDFRFRSIPDGLPDEKPRHVARFLDLVQSLTTRSRGHFKDLLSGRCGDDSSGAPPVTCLVVDGILTFAFDVAEEVAIPVIAFRTSSACSLLCYLSIPRLIDAGEIPFPRGEDGGGGLDAPVRGVPTMESFLRRRDLPSFLREAAESTDVALRFVADTATNVGRARGLVLNTYDDLEGPVVAHIRSHSRTTYTLGPLPALLRSFCSSTAGDDEDGTATATAADISASMWHEDRTCMQWLDAQPRGSVIYVSFGSLTVMARDRVDEFWHGLANSGHRFLWVIRPGQIQGEDGEEVPVAAPSPEVAQATAERGCMVGWAPQAEVLAHDSVGAFLTHGGWNSVLESVVAGVPMVCWPALADQPLNSRYMSEVWRVGLDMKDLCERGVVERMVREAMEGETAAELQRRAAEMAAVAERVVVEGGPSYTNVQRLIQDIRSMA